MLKSPATRIVATILSALLLAGEARSEETRPLDTAVKAAYLLNFGRFATWPAASNPDPAAFNLCVLGPDPFGSTLDGIVKGESIDGRRVSVKRLESPSDVATCRILFVGAIENTRLKHVFPVIEKAGILTVSDLPHFTDLGGMIQFVVEGNKVRFRVNLPAVDQAGLVLSSELLRVAASVATERIH